MEPHPEPALAQIAVAQVHDRALPRIHAAQSIYPRAAREHRLEQPELGEHRHARRLEQDARADRPRLGDAFVERDPVTLAREEQRGRRPSGAAAHDADVE